MRKRPTTLDPLQLFFDYGFLNSTRVLYMGGEVTQESADATIKGILALESLDPLGPITLVLSTEGGCYYPALALYDALRATSCPTTIKVLGHCMSSGMVILQGADTRLIGENARLMIHDGTEAYEGHARNMEIWGKQSGRDRETMYEIFASRSNKSVAWFREHCKHDYMLTPSEAIALGLADGGIKKYEQPVSPDKA